MKQKARGLLGVLLAVCMVIGMIPVTGITVFAEETTPAKDFVINMVSGKRTFDKLEETWVNRITNSWMGEEEIISTNYTQDNKKILFTYNTKTLEATVSDGVKSIDNVTHTITDEDREYMKKELGSDQLADCSTVSIVFSNENIIWSDNNTITLKNPHEDSVFYIGDVFVNGKGVNNQGGYLKTIDSSDCFVDAQGSVTFNPMKYIMEYIDAEDKTLTYTVKVVETYGGVKRKYSSTFYTTEKTILDIGQLSTPSNVNFDGKTVSWSPVSGATGYEVVLEKQASATEIVATKKVTSSYCSFAEDVKDGEAYVVRVTAIDENYKKLPSDAAYWYPSLTIQIPLGKSNLNDLSAQEQVGILALVLSGELTSKSEGDVAFYYSKSEPDKLLFSIDNKTNEVTAGETVTTDDKVMYVYPEKDRKYARYRDITLSFVNESEVTATPITVTGGDAMADGKVVYEAVEGTQITIVAGEAPEGMKFQGWKVLSGEVALSNPLEATTTFVVGKQDVTIIAEYVEGEPVVSETPIVSEAPFVSEIPVVSDGAIASEAPIASGEPTVSEAPIESAAPEVTGENPPAVSAVPGIPGENPPVVSAAPGIPGENPPVVSVTPGIPGNNQPAVSETPAVHTHSTTLVPAKEATCKGEGNKAYYTCSCGKWFEDAAATVEITDKNSVVLPKADHKKVTIATAAAVSVDGKVEEVCSICGEKFSETVIPKVEKIELAKISYEYDGNVKNPNVVVKDSNGKDLVKDTDYTVKYADDRKSVGKYAVEITLQGNYTGTKTLYFTVNPKGTSLSSVKAGKKKVTVKWKKQASQTTGYQIQYGTNSKFKSAKTKTISKNKTVSVTISKLTAKKKYYVRIRTYKTVKVGGSSEKLYSGWSKVKNVKIK